jgi:zinc-binding alcohol dehydrogenase family protein
MKAVVYTHCRPIDAEDALFDTTLPDPAPRQRDLLVEVKAVAVNPVDTKLRRQADPVGEKRVLGFDAAGVVRALGAGVTHFGVGDEVWYAGAINRAGANAEYQLVDERLVGRRPRRLSFAEAAAMPLATLTAWEMLFDRLQVPRAAAGSLLIVGGAGGVGSMAIQLARRLTALTVIATASRPESVDWCKRLGAHHVIDYRGDIPAQLAELGFRSVDVIFSTNASDQHWPALVRAIRPQGRIGLIDDPAPIDVRDLKQKSVSLHWEAMFTRSLFETPDMAEQQRILEQVAALVDEGVIETILAENFGRIDAANLTRAHRRIESGTMRGKIVLEGF